MKEDISSKNNKQALTENNYALDNNNQYNFNRRQNLLKDDNADKGEERQVSNFRTDSGVLPRPSSPKLNIEIVGDSMINGITPVGLRDNCENRFRIKPYRQAISEKPLQSHTPRTQKKTKRYSNAYWYKWQHKRRFSNFQYNLNKICRLFTELEQSTKIVLYSNIPRHDQRRINVEENSGNKINRQLCKTNILDLIDNSNMNDEKLVA